MRIVSHSPTKRKDIAYGSRHHGETSEPTAADGSPSPTADLLGAVGADDSDHSPRVGESAVGDSGTFQPGDRGDDTPHPWEDDVHQ